MSESFVSPQQLFLSSLVKYIGKGGVILGVIHGIKLKNVLECFVDVGQLYPLTSYIH